jgi:hypothetical protein
MVILPPILDTRELLANFDDGGAAGRAHLLELGTDGGASAKGLDFLQVRFAELIGDSRELTLGFVAVDADRSCASLWTTSTKLFRCMKSRVM